MKRHSMLSRGTLSADRKLEWESERKLETLRAAEDKLRIVCEWEAYIELTEARDAEREGARSNRIEGDGDDCTLHAEPNVTIDFTA